MGKLNIKDSFNFLTVAAAKVEIMASQLDQYLSSYFKEVKTYYSRKSIFGQVMNFIKDLSNLIFYYVHRSATENNIITAQSDVSLAHFAELSGHHLVRYISAKGSVRFHFLPNTSVEIGNTIIVRKYAQLKCSANSLTYLVDIPDEHRMLSLSTSEFVLPVIEGMIKEQSFVATGDALYTIRLEDTSNIENNEVKVYVDGKEWTRVLGLTEMTVDSENFIIKTGYVNNLDIIFGNGTRGKIPPRGVEVRVEYLVSNGEFGNIPEGMEVTFEPQSGFFDGNSEEVDLKDYCTVNIESGFILGSYGDSQEVLRNIIGYNDRTLVLASNKNYEALISQFSTLSRVHVWSDPDNLAVKNLLVLPNLSPRLQNTKDYLNIAPEDFFLTTAQKQALQNYIDTSEKSYVALELRFVEPTVRKYVLNVYIDLGEEERITLKNTVEDSCINTFVTHTFDKLKTNENLDIVKADIIKGLREVLPKADSISVNILCDANEEAKINGFYYKRENLVLKSTTKKVTVPADTDPCIGLSENNDIVSEWLDIVPILRGGFQIYNSNGNPVVIDDAVNVYLKTDNGSTVGWTKLLS